MYFCANILSIYMSNTKQEQNIGKAPYKNCLNCGTELTGMYCHSCGQESINPNPTIGGFVFEYISNAFMWDSRFLRTIWLLVRRPGQLTNEFMHGKIVSYVHPLKLNMFMLFVFITLFLMFADTNRLGNSVGEFTHDEKVFPLIHFGLLQNNAEYAEKIQQSPRDTVQLVAPLMLAAEYPHLVSLIETLEDTHGEGMDKWTAAIPHVLVEDKILIEDSEGNLKFNMETGKMEELEILDKVWKEMLNITTRYFPIIILLTAPFLSISLRLVQRKKKYTHFNNFIFALHYTAFIELITLAMYVIHLIFAPSSGIFQWILSIGSIAYLTIAFRNAYDTSSWWRASAKALFTSIIYSAICIIAFFCIFSVACILVAEKI